MTDQADLAAQLAALQAQIAAMRPAASPWGAAAAPSAAPIINGVAVPVKVQTPAGSIRLYFSLPAECAATPEALMAALESLAAAGLPLDTWSPRESAGGSAWGGNNRPGYGSSYGGYGSNRNWRR
jgi:hypothetical protein